MTLLTGEQIHVNDTGPILVVSDKRTQTLDAWALKNCPAIIRAAEAGRWAETETATTPQRLARAVAELIQGSGGAVTMGGVIFAHTGTGYELVSDDICWVGNLLRQVVEADCRHLLDWGFAAKLAPVTGTTCRDTLIHLRSLLPHVAHFGADLDGHVDLSRAVNYTNGIWVPHTGELIPHSPRYFVRPSIGIEYSDTRVHPEFTRYLDGALPEAEQQQLAQELAGCIMAGDRTHQKAGYLFGAARAGKGTFTAVCQQLVGEGNYQGIDSDTLGYTFGLEDLIGKQLVVVNEAQDLSKKQVSRIKAATGNDDFTIPGKNRASYRGKLLCNWLLVTNNIIELPDSSAAIVGRLKVLDFRNSFSGREDLQLSSKLTKELPAIAAWAREGYLRFIRNGKLSENQHGDQTAKQLKEASSPVATFVDECCSLTGQTGKKALYTAYLAWAQENGHDTMSTHRFTTEIRSAAPSIRMSNRGTRYWTGITITNETKPS